MDEIIFSASYKNWVFSERFDLSNASEQDVAYALAHIREHIENEAFCRSGVDCEGIEAAIPEGNGMHDLIKVLESRKPWEWKEFLLKFAGKEELLPVAEAKLVCALLKKNGISAKIESSMIKSLLKPQKQELFEGQVAFIGRYKDWMAIKKLGVDETTRDYEISGILSAINTTLVGKSFDFLHPDRSVESIAEAATRGKRKSFINLSQALRQVEPSLAGDRIRASYLLKCVFEKLGFAPYANVEVLTAAYPDLKVPKPRGRFSKK